MTGILIIESDRSACGRLRMLFSDSGCRCDCALDGKKAADLLEHRNYDLVLLDLVLPKISGWELLDYLCLSKTPVIVLAQRSTPEERIRAFHCGADDFLTHPLHPGELLARAEAVLRRCGHSEEALVFGNVRLSPLSRQVWKGNEPVALTVKEFDLLLALMRHKNTALSRADLYETVWQSEYTGETRTLDSHIQRLRKKLDWEQCIKTVFRVGYRLDDPVG